MWRWILVKMAWRVQRVTPAWTYWENSRTHQREAVFKTCIQLDKLDVAWMRPGDIVVYYDGQERIWGNR